MMVRSGWPCTASCTNDKAVPPMKRNRYVLSGSTSMDAKLQVGEVALPGSCPWPLTMMFSASPLHTRGCAFKPASICESVPLKMSDNAMIRSSSY